MDVEITRELPTDYRIISYLRSLITVQFLFYFTDYTIKDISEDVSLSRASVSKMIAREHPAYVRDAITKLELIGIKT